MKPAYRRDDALARIGAPQPCVSRDLIVSAAASVKFRRQLSDFLVKQAINERVNILVGRGRKLAALESEPDSFQSVANSHGFVGSENARFAKREGPSVRQAHVERPEAKINAN